MIRVVVDELAHMSVDAILRPADEVLAPATAEMSRLDGLAGEGFLAERRMSSPLEAGAAVVTGGGALPAPFVLHVIIRDPASPVGREVVRRALVSAWQRAEAWGLQRVAAPLVGVGLGELTLEESAGLLAETFGESAATGGPAELHIVVGQEAERELVEAVVRRMQ